MIEISGEYTTAHIMGLDEGEVEQNAIEQIQEMVDHEAFTQPVKVMSDCHIGPGAIIGFTMPLDERVVPNVVGLDIGCGVLSGCLGDDVELTGESLDERVRNTIPMGTGPMGLKAPNRDYYHIVNEFPWNEVNKTLDAFIEAQEGDWIPEMRAFQDAGGYGEVYFKELVNKRAMATKGRFNMNTAINSIGTLGGGNHFIELGQSVETGDYWVTVHSGSRGLGAKTASYWQNKATEHLDAKYTRDERASRIRNEFKDYPDDYFVFDPGTVTDSELLNWVQGGMGQDFIKYDSIPPTDREDVREELKIATSIAKEGGDTAEPLDYLEGEAAGGYLIDMIFCQKYAAKSRELMAQSVAHALDVEITDKIQSTHNFIDFRDGIIRKGATRAYEGERTLVPFNMKAGTLIIEGVSNPAWNYSSPHGAGRVMSRTQARKEFDEVDVRNEMASIQAFSTTFPVEEAPGAYKDPALIENAIKDTAQIVDRLEVVHNFKAD